MNAVETLKQAAQALRTLNRADSYMNIEALAAALEAMAEQRPVCWASLNAQGVVTTTSNRGDGWRKTPLYAAPIATPEHDAKVRDAALEEAARCADAHSGRPVAGEVMAHAIRYLKSTGADHE